MARKPVQAGRLGRLGVLCALAVAIVTIGVLEVQSVDFFWHLAAGQWMLEHGEILAFDPFRFTNEGIPWVDHEWGFQVVLAVAERLGGLAGAVALRALLVAALAGLMLFSFRRRGVPLPAAALVALIALVGARGRFLLRPEIVSLVAFALLLVLLEQYRSRGGIAPVAALVLLVAAWANVHPGVLAAPPVAAAFLFGGWLGRRRPADPRLQGPPLGSGSGWGSPAAWRRRRRRRRLRWRDVLGVPALLALAVLANPWGWRVYQVPIEISRALAGLPAANPDWAPLWERPQPFLFVAFGLLALLLVTALLRSRWIDPAYGLAVAAVLPLVVSGARHSGLFFVAGAFLAAEELAGMTVRRALPRWLDDGWRGASLASAACLLAAAWCLWPPAAGPLAPAEIRHRVGVGIVPGRFPQHAVDRLERLGEVGPLFNSAPFGGYLLWRLYPSRQVFIDTRNEVDPELLRRLAAARGDEERWRELLAAYGVDAALVRYETRRRPVLTPATGVGGEPVVEHHTASAFLFPRDRFALVYFDDVAMLFLLRRPGREALLEALEYRRFEPEDWRAMLERAARDPEYHAAVAAEARRRMGEQPPSRRASGLYRMLILDPAAGGSAAASNR